MVSGYRINITLDYIGPNHYVGSYISEYLQYSERISDDEQRPGKEMALMPTLLSTPVKHIHDRVPNSVNSKLIEDFHSYMKDNTTSERHQNSTLKAIIAFAEFVGLETTFYQISSKEQITKFLETQIKSNSEDPKGRWIASI
ncbi:MAG: hypothetical protein WBV84_05355 [Nitrososphaeraceae archaeon]